MAEDIQNNSHFINFILPTSLKMPVSEDLEQGQLGGGICDRLEDKVARLKTLTKRYELEGYLNEVKVVDVDDVNFFLEKVLAGQIKIDEEIIAKDHYGNKIFVDKYERYSIPIAVRHNGGMIGSTRLILMQKGTDIPAHSFPLNPELPEDTKLLYLGSIVEYSQLAVDKDIDQMLYGLAALCLMRLAVQISKINGVNYWVAVMDNTSLSKLNSPKLYNFSLSAVNESVFYLGSDSTPVVIDIDASILSMGESNFMSMYVEFLKGVVDIPFFKSGGNQNTA